MNFTSSKNTVREDVKQIALLTLTGSEKQIAWATKIREDAICGLFNKTVASYGRFKTVTVEIDDRIIEALNMHTDAGFIIDNRSHYDFTDRKGLAKCL